MAIHRCGGGRKYNFYFGHLHAQLKIRGCLFIDEEDNRYREQLVVCHTQCENTMGSPSRKRWIQPGENWRSSKDRRLFHSIFKAEEEFGTVRQMACQVADKQSTSFHSHHFAFTQTWEVNGQEKAKRTSDTRPLLVLWLLSFAVLRWLAGFVRKKTLLGLNKTSVFFLNRPWKICSRGQSSWRKGTWGRWCRKISDWQRLVVWPAASQSPLWVYFFLCWIVN